MDKRTITALVNAEMDEYFPRKSQGSRNNILRAYYNMLRRNDLARNVKLGATIISEQCRILISLDLQPQEWLKRAPATIQDYERILVK